ncbi:MAG: hypothetical protein AB1439_00600 [candidate division FCPU426 bacterium]
MADPLFRATLLLGGRHWFQESLGQEAYKRFLAQLPPQDAEYWSSDKVLSVSRLPGRLFLQTYDYLASLNDGDPRLFRELAAFSAFHDLSTVLTIFLKIGTPLFIAKRVPAIFKRYFTPGSMSVAEVADKRVVYHMHDTQVWKQSVCVGCEGWVSTALQYSGAESVRARQLQCIRQGKSHCVLEFTWS